MNHARNLQRLATDLKVHLRDDEEIASWLERLDLIGSYGSLDEIRQCLDDAPTGARETGDYWYARGVLATRTENESRPSNHA